MEADYYEVTSELNAREVLRYLNDLGIHNISGEVLKYFLTDLKKFIKYDLQKKQNSSTAPADDYIEGVERLHSATTFSSRCRSLQEGEKIKCTRNCFKTHQYVIRNAHSAPTMGHKTVEEKPLRRACSCVRIERKPESSSIPSKSTTSANLIKVPRQPVKKKCDPVNLYHYYTLLWDKYKPNVPGENNWADLRWEMRQKMAGVVEKPQVKKVSTKVPDHKAEKLKKDRDEFKKI